MNKFSQKLHHYYCLLRFDRPIGTYLLLWPTLWAVWLASKGQPPAQILVIFILGVITMRAAGSAINDIIDRKFDGHVKRTQQRPLAQGKLSLFEALIGFALFSCFALFLVAQLNFYAQLIALIGAVLVIAYPFSKRFLRFPQCVLGMTWSLGIFMAYAAIQNHIPWQAVVLYLSHFILTIAYDTMYAMCDREDDQRLGLNSTALLFGTWDKWFVAGLQVMVILLFIGIGYFSRLNDYFYLFLSFAAMTMVYQQWLIRNYDFDGCLNAFRNNHYTGLFIFLGIFLGLLK